MPGSYHTEWSEGDLANGALYDRGAFLYAPSGGPRGDGAGRASLALYRRDHPQANPARILDLGCATGGPLLPYAEAFPQAELHGVDVGAPLLRFGHLRFEKAGIPIHFRQADAAATGYPDDHFDLIVSHITFHETSAAAVPAIVKEAHRILKPGGVFLFVDLPNVAIDPRRVPTGRVRRRCPLQQRALLDAHARARLARDLPARGLRARERQARVRTDADVLARGQHEPAAEVGQRHVRLLRRGGNQVSAPNPPGTGRVARLARGKRPVYGTATAEQVNQLLAAVTSLTAEVSVLRQRVKVLEALGTKAGWLAADAVDRHQPGAAEREEQAGWNEALLSRVFYLAVEAPPAGSAVATPDRPTD